MESADWMANLPEELQTIQIYKLAIPGSHNSGAHNLSGEVAPDAPKIIKKLTKIPGIKRAVMSFVRKWCECQAFSITQQLNSGIRYLDMRVCSKLNNDDLFLVHGLYGSEVKYALEEVNEFVDHHPGEVVIMDFNHFYKMNADHHKKLISQIISTFGCKLCGSVGNQDLTLKTLKSNNKRVICIYHHKEAESEKDLWQNQSILSPWPNTKRPSTCIEKLTWFMEKASDPEAKFQFVVCQGILTPDVPYTLAHLASAGVHRLNQDLRPFFLSWLDESSAKWQFQPNIVIHDFIEEENYIQHVLDLNKHRIVNQKTKE